MPKKQKKGQSKSPKSPVTKKYVLFFGLVILIGALFLTIMQSQDKQTLQQQAATTAGTCGSPGDMGNSLGVGKYCTQGGGQCQGLNASICSADIQLNGSGICSKSCNTDADCGTGAVCYQDTLGKGCEPISCQDTPTPTQTPTSGVPSSGCLGAGCPQPTVSTTPSSQPSQSAPTATPTPTGTGGGANFFQLFVQFFLQIIASFLNLLKSI
jgi:hypothetical protein